MGKSSNSKVDFPAMELQPGGAERYWQSGRGRHRPVVGFPSLWYAVVTVV